VPIAQSSSKDMTPAVSAWEKLRHRHKDPGLLVIAVWKLFRGTVLLVVSLWALAALHDNDPSGTHHPFVQWCIHHLHAAGNHRFIHRFLVAHGVMRERNLQLLCIVAGLYSLKLFVEGIGLWFEKLWAQYLTIIFTSALLPVAIYELTRHITVPRIAALEVNLLVVAYLGYRLRQRHKSKAASQDVRLDTPSNNKPTPMEPK
jgi:uncharacterized membrane protein (DUF2068 family)